MLLIKDPEFRSNITDIPTTQSTHEMYIFTKFYKDWTKIVDFLLIAKFLAVRIIMQHPLYLFLKKGKKHNFQFGAGCIFKMLHKVNVLILGHVPFRRPIKNIAGFVLAKVNA